MAFTDYQEFAEPPLAFPINGKTYNVPPVGIMQGLKLAGVVLGEDHSLSDLPASELWRLTLGPAWDEMVADNVPVSAVARAGMAALVDFRDGRAAAEAVWNSQLDPEALAAYMAANPTPTNTAVATTTPRPASTSGTSSPRANRRKTPRTASGSRGRQSSSSGR